VGDVCPRFMLTGQLIAGFNVDFRLRGFKSDELHEEIFTGMGNREVITILSASVHLMQDKY